MRGGLPCGRPASPLSTTKEPGGEKLDHWKAQLRAYLAAHGLKFSEQRWRIAQHILGTKGHFSAQQIVRDVTRAIPGLGTATVYRNIKVLCDARILKETLIDAGGTMVYEIFDEHHHDHIVCLDCGEIFEFHDETIENSQARVTRDLKFEDVSHRHVIYAHCLYKQQKKN